MSRRARFLLPLLLTLSALAAHAPEASAQESAAQPASFRALPESDAVVVVDVQRALSDVVPRVLAKEPRTLLQMNTAIAAFKATTGIDARRVNRLVVALREVSPEKMSKGEFRGVIIAEGIDTEKLLGLMLGEEKGKVREENYQGQMVYTHPKSPDKPTDWDMSVTALDANTFLLGTPEEVRLSLDARAGRAPGASAELLSALTPRPNSLVTLAVRITPSMLPSFKSDATAEGQAAAPGESQPAASSGAQGDKADDQMANVFKTALSSFRMFRAAVGLTPDGYDILAALKVADADRASATREALEGFRALSVMRGPKNARDRTAQDFLRRVKIESVGDEVQLSTNVTHAALESLIRTLNADEPSARPAGRRGTPPRARATRRRRG